MRIFEPTTSSIFPSLPSQSYKPKPKYPLKSQVNN